MEERIARLRWQCRRGMLELDAILQPFFDQYFQTLSIQDQHDFERLLTHSDPELFAWFIGSEHPQDESLHNLVRLIKSKDLHS